MAMKKLSANDIPQKLSTAKESALKDYFSSNRSEGLMPFAARPNPQHNVVGIGLGRKITDGKLRAEHCVRFYVEKKLPKEAIPAGDMLPNQIEGVATDVIETGRFHALARQRQEQRVQRPARPGCSVGFSFGVGHSHVMAGTFGAVVERDGKWFVLSNNHVLANENALAPGEAIYQPGLRDNSNSAHHRIARLTEFVKLERDQHNHVDCAIAEVLENKFVSPKVMPRINKLKSGDPVVATDGMKVEKTGRSSGYTVGTIEDVGATIKVGFELGTLTFAHQILIEGSKGVFAEGGDSGSLIVERKSKRPVGLLFAGSGTHALANHIQDILQHLSVRIVA
jgi:hypothetical protein